METEAFSASLWETLTLDPNDIFFQVYITQVQVNIEYLNIKLAYYKNKEKPFKRNKWRKNISLQATRIKTTTYFKDLT